MHDGFAPDYTRAEITESLAAGTYTVEARTYSEGHEGPFTLTVSVAGDATPGPGGCDIATIMPGGSPEQSTWAEGCQSQVRAGHNARYYQFTLTESADVTITLESTEDPKDQEPVLYLREGEGVTSGAYIGFNEGESEYNYHRAVIEQNLAAATYTIEATTYTQGYTGDFTLTVSGAGGTGTKQTVIFSEPNWLSVQIQNRIAQFIVENGYEYPTDTVLGGALPLLEALRDGDTHVTMEIWLPNLSSPWEEALASGEVISLGSSLGSDWQSAFVIPAYLQEQHPELDSVEDLKEQQYKALFSTAETGGKARLVSCPVDWDCEPINAEQVAGYGLDDHVQIVKPTSLDDLYASINDAYERGEPWLGYMWSTADPALLLDLVRLEEPLYSDECWETTPIACAYEDATIQIGAHSGLPDLVPDVVEFLRNWDFAIDPHWKNTFRWWVANSDASIEEAASYWLRNNDATWSGWVTDEAAARIRSALSGS